MVRTLRSIEEEARVHRVRGPGLDRWYSDVELRRRLEGEVLDQAMAFLQDGTRRLLVAGLEDGGEAALALLRNGRFVTVVDPDEGAVEDLLRQAREARCDLRLNAIACDYMKREFATGGFDGAFMPAMLGRYNEPMVVLRKAARELRVGGRIAFRIPVRPSLDGVIRKVSSLPGADRVLPRITEAARNLGPIAAWMEVPGAQEFLEEAGQVFRLERVLPMHLLAPLAAALVPGGPTSLVPWFRKAVSLLDRVDRAVTVRAPLSRLAGVLMVHGTKELQLGRTFQV